MRLSILALLVLAASLARAASPVIGGALQYNVVFPHYNLVSLTESGWQHDYGCWGSQVTVGLTGRDATVYLGYQRTASSLYSETYSWWNGGDDHYYAQLQNSWREARLLAGIQWHLNGRGPYPVKPTVGAALTYGQSTFNWKETQGLVGVGEDTYADIARKSNNFGALFEFGLLVRPRVPVDLLVMAQVQRFEAGFPPDNNTGTADHYVVLVPGWHVQLRYRIPITIPPR